MKEVTPEVTMTVPPLVKAPAEVAVLPRMLYVAPAALVKAPEDEAVPAPTLTVPLFCTVETKPRTPVCVPRLPVEETAPVKVRVPEVEVTVPAPSHELPVTVIVVVPEERVQPVVEAFN